MLTSVPLLVVSFILYNLGLAGLFGDGPNGYPWATELFSFRTTLRAEKPGTLVLADIDQLEPALQREVTSLGSRIGLGRKGGWLLVATTTASLTELVRARQFDSNLADMLGGIVLTMPALRERRTDIAQLVRELLLALCDEQDAPRKSVTSEALDALAAYHWPGNVSELNVALEHATIAAGDDDRIDLSDLPRKVRGTPELAVPGTDGWPTLAQAEQRLIVATLQRFGGHQGSAAAALGIHPNTLGRKLKQFGLGRTRRHRPPA